MTNFNIYEFLKTRPLSWSALSSFEYDPEQWYQRYILNIQDPPSKEMIFGSKIGKKLEKDPTYLPMIPRHSKMEHEFRVMFGKIHLVGFADTFCTVTNKKLGEYKTGKKAWDQKRVNEHGQLTMYCLMHFITTKIKPENLDILLAWMPTQEGGDFSISFVEPIEENIKIFKTKRTMKDVLIFGSRITSTVRAMQEYVENHA